MGKTTSNHLSFWLIYALVLSGMYSITLPSFNVTVIVVLLLLPVHILYYYSVANWIIPRNLDKKSCTSLIIGVVGCCIVSTFLFRVLEITVVDPYIFRKMVQINPNYSWKKINGTFTSQLSSPLYLINALEQSNSVIWIALSIRYFKLWYQRRQVILQSEVDFLKAKLHPHFLFNTLNNLYALTLSRSSESPKIVLGLSTVLRYMLYECNTSRVPLKRDVEILESYISLEKIRYENRLRLKFNVDGIVDGQQIPPLLLIPLIEQAFKEAVSEILEEPWININLEVNGSSLKLMVSHGLPDLKMSGNKKNPENLDLSNLMRKIETQFSGGYDLYTREEGNSRTAVMKLNLDKQYKDEN